MSLAQKMRKRHTPQVLLSLLGIVVLTGCRTLKAFEGNPYAPQLETAQRLLAQKNRSGAIDEMDKAISGDRSNIDLYFAVMRICASQDIDLVAKYGETGIAAAVGAPSEKRAELMRVTGQAYLQLENPSRAVALLEAAKQLQSKHPAYLNDLGYAYAELHQDPDVPGALNKLQEALRLTQDAIAMARDMRASDAEMGVYMDSLGWIYYRLKRYRDAVIELSRAADLASDQKDIFAHLGLALHAEGRKEEAVVAMKKARKLAPNDTKIAAKLREWEAALLQAPIQTSTQSNARSHRALIRSEK